MRSEARPAIVGGMANTYGSAHFHLIFSTKNRAPWIVPAWRNRLHAWLAGAIARSGVVPVEVGGVGDHVHLLAGLRPSHRLADLMLDWKRGSSRWIHDDCGARGFAWQDGYSYFAVSHADVEAVRAYVKNQEEHHRRVSFADEMAALWQANGRNREGG